MLTEQEVQEICEYVKAKISRETGIERSRIDQLLDVIGEYQPTDEEWEKIKPVFKEIFKMYKM